jgi:excisionase family DNA binding protein
MLRTTEAAGYIGLKKSTLEAWRVRGEGPVFLKLGKAVRYRKEDIDAFLEANLRKSTSDPGHESAAAH